MRPRRIEDRQDETAVVERHRYDMRATLENLDFRLAGPEDVDGLVAFYMQYFGFSVFPDYGLTLDPERLKAWVTRVVASGYKPHIIAVDKVSGRIVGALDYNLDSGLFDHPIAEMDKFFVLPQWRLSGAGRVLLALAMETAKGDGAVVFRGDTFSGIGIGRNLFLRQGFDELAGAGAFIRRL
jgi:GNAT superfamily N-acetyltransferase